MSRLRAEITHRDSARPPIMPGSWVVVADVDFSRPVELAIVADGPEYTHASGHALGEVWTLEDGSKRSGEDLTALDVPGVLVDATALLRTIRLGGRADDVETLRVHRVACLARRALGSGVGHRDLLTAIVEVDQAIGDMEMAVRDMIRVRLPNLARSLYDAGALALARSPGWGSPGEPGDPMDPHPRWPVPAAGESTRR